MLESYVQNTDHVVVSDLGPFGRLDMDGAGWWPMSDWVGMKISDEADPRGWLGQRVYTHIGTYHFIHGTLSPQLIVQI